MSRETWGLALKSTIDKIVHALAEELDFAYVDLDGESLNADLLASDETAIAWSLVALTESPRDPLYQVEFEIGAKTSSDPAGYTSFEIVGKVTEAFASNSRVDIYDYSGVPEPTTREGVLLIGASGVNPQQFDRTSGLRLISIVARAQRIP